MKKLKTRKYEITRGDELIDTFVCIVETFAAIVSCAIGNYYRCYCTGMMGDIDPLLLYPPRSFFAQKIHSSSYTPSQDIRLLRVQTRRNLHNSVLRRELCLFGKYRFREISELSSPSIRERSIFQTNDASANSLLF